jgi:hypothetical protein
MCQKNSNAGQVYYASFLYAMLWIEVGIPDPNIYVVGQCKFKIQRLKAVRFVLYLRIIVLYCITL